jgi:hypothetical protein
MTDDIVFSSRGVAFTSEAVDTMRGFAESLRQSNAIPIWEVYVDDAGQTLTILCGDYAPSPKTVPDQIGGIVFYWFADERAFDVLRNRCVDVGQGRKSRLLDLPSGVKSRVSNPSLPPANDNPS